MTFWINQVTLSIVRHLLSYILTPESCQTAWYWHGYIIKTLTPKSNFSSYRPERAETVLAA
jgi:hypothetical protein